MKYLLALALLIPATPVDAMPIVRPIVRPRAAPVTRTVRPVRPARPVTSRPTTVHSEPPYWWHVVYPYVGAHTPQKERRLLDECRNTPEDEMSDACLELLDYE